MDPIVPQTPAQTTNYPNWRAKILLVCVILMLLITIFVIIKRISISHTKTASHILTHSAPPVTVVPTIMQAAPSVSALKSYEGDNLSFQYPTTWQLRVDTQTAERQVIVAGSRLAEKTGVPSLSVTAVISTSSAAFDLSGDVISSASGSGFIKSTIVSNGLSIVRLSGIIPITVVQGKPQFISHRESIANFQHGNWLYQLVFSYPGDKVDADYEALFMHIIQSMRFSAR